MSIIIFYYNIINDCSSKHNIFLDTDHFAKSVENCLQGAYEQYAIGIKTYIANGLIIAIER